MVEVVGTFIPTPGALQSKACTVSHAAVDAWFIDLIIYSIRVMSRSSLALLLVGSRKPSWVQHYLRRTPDVWAVEGFRCVCATIFLG
jgi:hypothetical protein